MRWKAFLLYPERKILMPSIIFCRIWPRESSHHHKMWASFSPCMHTGVDGEKQYLPHMWPGLSSKSIFVSIHQTSLSYMQSEQLKHYCKFKEALFFFVWKGCISSLDTFSRHPLFSISNFFRYMVLPMEPC